MANTTPLEEHQIKGITPKLIWTVIGSTAILLLFFIRGYIGVISAIAESTTSSKTNSIAISQLQISMSQLQAKTDKMQIEMNEFKIEYYKEKSKQP